MTHQTREISHAAPGIVTGEQGPAPAALPPAPRVRSTVNQFCARHPAFTPGGVRDLIFKSRERRTSTGTIPGNGLDVAIIRVGRKIIIDEARWFAVIDSWQGGAR